MTGTRPLPELQALLDAAVEGIVLIDHQGLIQSFNRAAERLFGYRGDEVIGNNVSRLATVGEMASGIAHELNQPLAAIATYAHACDRLLGSPDPDIDEIRAALKQIADQAVRAGDIIRRLRTLR